MNAETLEGLLAAALLGAFAFAWGRRLLAMAAFPGRLLGIPLAGALGLGALSLFQFGAGLIGIPPAGAVWGALVAGAALLALDLWRQRTRLAGDVRTLHFDGTAAAQAAGAAVLLGAMALGLPEPVHDYDSLEYHLGAPAAYLRLGRIAPLDDNLYAAMPENQEMLFLTGLAATRTHAGGAAGAKGMNLLCWALAALALFAWARRHGETRAGGWAALLLLASPWAQLTGGHLPYVEPGLVLHGTLAALAVWEGFPLLGGVLAGFAVGTKYPALLFVLAPLLALQASRGLRPMLRLLGGTALSASPWLLKNLLAYGNPLHPILSGIPAWDQAHAPSGEAAAALAGAARGLLLAPALLVFLPFALGPRRKPFALPLLAWLLGGLGAWLAFTHRVDRFLLPVLPAACLLAALGAEGMARLPGGWAGRIVLAAACLPGPLGSVLAASPAPAPGLRPTYSAEGIRQVNLLPEGSRVLFVGEAETYFVRLDGRVRITAPTVFDPKPFESDPGLSAFTHVYVNEAELDRLQATYGDRRHGYSPRARGFLASLKGRSRILWEDGGGRWRLLALEPPPHA